MEMLSNLLTVTGQVATLFLMIAVGFVLGRTGKMTEAGRSQMSYLLLYICLLYTSQGVRRGDEGLHGVGRRVLEPVERRGCIHLL